MARATAVPLEEAPTRTLRRLRDLAGALEQELEFKDLRTGDWFTQLLTTWLRHYDAHDLHLQAQARGCTAQATEALIRRACVQTGLSGASAASVATGTSVYAANAGVSGLLLALPVGGLAVGGEMLWRALVHLRMTCDLAAAFGVRFHPEHPADVALLYALVFKTERHEGAQDLGGDLIQRLVLKETRELGEAVGSKLLSESMLRNLLPFANVVTSALTNVRRTRELGEVALRYARSLRALQDAMAALRRTDEGAVELLLESLWFACIADGRLRHEEAAVLAYLLRHAPVEMRDRVLERMGRDESAWLRRLRGMPERAREPMLHALVVSSAMDLAASEAELQLLRRAAQALGRPLEPQRLEGMIERLSTEGLVPEPPVARPTVSRGTARTRTRERPAPAAH